MSTHPINKWVYRLLTLLGIVLTLVCLLIIVWLLRPYNYVQASQPVTTQQKYFAGSTVYYRYNEFCVTAPTALAIQRYVYNVKTGQKIALLPYAFNKEHVMVDCFDDLQVTLPLPREALAPGKYQVISEMSYKPNPVRRVTQKFTTNTFTIVADPSEKN